MSLFDTLNEIKYSQEALNNPNLGGAQFTPKRNLEEAYNRAMGKTTPNWAINLSNAMPSIGEIVANATIKNGFQQRPVAESLERQKQRQQAYNQWLKENEQNQVNDYVQMAKEQLGLDMADDDTQWNRNWAEKNFDYKTKQDILDEAYRNKLFEFNKDKFLKEFLENQRQYDEGNKIKRFAIGSENYCKSLENERQDKELQAKLNTVANVDTSKFSDEQKYLANAVYDDYKAGKITPEQYVEQMKNIVAGKGITLTENKKNGILGGIANLSKLTTDAILNNKSYLNNNKVSITEEK